MALTSRADAGESDTAAWAENLFQELDLRDSRELLQQWVPWMTRTLYPTMSRSVTVF
jgi:hypothetical protein